MSISEQTVIEPAKEFSVRRKHPRRYFDRAVGLLHRGDYQMVRGIEIGEGGMSVVCDSPLEEGAQIVLSFQIPKGGFVVMTADIRSCVERHEGRYRIGCHFRKIKFENKREIRTFVSARG